MRGGPTLELVPVSVPGEGASAAKPSSDDLVDVMLERTAPGERPAGSTGEPRKRHAVRLYEEAVALVVSSDHELATERTVDPQSLPLFKLLAHPDHAASWPSPEPWRDPSWAPRDAQAALEVVATGAGGILISLPLARHLSEKRRHAVLPVEGDPPLPGTEIWASWSVERDDPDIQQLIGIFRGRTPRSSRRT